MPNLGKKLKKALIATGSAAVITAVGVTIYSEMPDQKTSEKALQTTDLADIQFNKPSSTPRETSTNCARADGPAKAGWFATSFEAATKSGEALSGTVCFDQKRQSAEIIFDRKNDDTPPRPNITVLLKK